MRLKVRLILKNAPPFGSRCSALARAVYPTLGGRGARVFAEGGEARVASAHAWERMPSNPY